MYVKNAGPSNSYRFLEFLFKNPNKLLQNTAIAEGIKVKRTSLSYTGSRMKDFIQTSGKCENVLKVVIQNGRRIYFKCVLPTVDNVENWANKYHKLYKEFNLEWDRNRQGRDKKGSKLVTKAESAPALPANNSFENMRQLANTGGNPIDVPINIAITVSVNFRKV